MFKQFLDSNICRIDGCCSAAAVFRPAVHQTSTYKNLKTSNSFQKSPLDIRRRKSTCPCDRINRATESSDVRRNSNSPSTRNPPVHASNVHRRAVREKTTFHLWTFSITIYSIQLHFRENGFRFRFWWCFSVVVVVVVVIDFDADPFVFS